MDLPLGFYLDWDWHWLTFIFLLAVSVMLVVVLKKRVLWLLPAIVMYFGLHWEIPGVWSALFNVFFWLTMIIALVTFVFSALGRTRRTLFAEVPALMMSGLVLFCLILATVSFVMGWSRAEEDHGAFWSFVAVPFVVGLAMLFLMRRVGAALLALTILSVIVSYGSILIRDDRDPVVDVDDDVCLTIDGKTNKKVQTEVPAGYEVDQSKDCVFAPQDEEPEVVVDGVRCPPKFRQELDRNWRNRFDSDGLRGVSREKRKQTLENIREDYRYLHAWADVLFSRDIERRTLVNDEKTCLSPEGRRLYNQITGALMASGVRSGQAPADAYNTGMDDGRMVVAAARGIRGDRSATIYTLPNGSKVYVLDRCGNFALVKKPKGVPEGRTDNPRPPRQTSGPAPKPSKSPDSPTPSKPTPTLQPKSSNPKDYKVEEGAPKATVTEPASKPSEVKTEQPGGGGVTDSPTNEPGSESGVQAPESDPAPSYSPPPAEEGANDPSDGGTSCVPPPGVEKC